MLNGSWKSQYGIHNILFYVDKQNPLGDLPEDPSQDPQYKLWEKSVEKWLGY